MQTKLGEERDCSQSVVHYAREWVAGSSVWQPTIHILKTTLLFVCSLFTIVHLMVMCCC